LPDIREVPFLADILNEISAKWPNLEENRIIHELGRRLITRFVEGVITTSVERLSDFDGKSAASVRAASQPVIAFSGALEQADRDIKRFLFARMYRNPNVMRVRGEAEAVLRDLFSAFNADPNRLPDDWQARVKRTDEKARVRHITDYIAGMTDRFALQEHRRLFDVTPELR